MNAPNILIRKFQDYGLQVDLKPRGFYQAEVMRANGRVDKYPVEENAINPKFRDYLLQRISEVTDNATGSNRFQSLLFGTSAGQTTMVIGSNGDAINAYDQTALWTHPADRAVNEYLAHTTTMETTGNQAEIDATTGNLVMTVRMRFAAATSTQTVREVAIGGTNCYMAVGAWFQTARISRSALSSPIVLNIGDVLTMSYTMVIPTLTITPQTVTLAAQNGMNLSGQLKLVGTYDNIRGGTVSASGSVSGSAVSSNTTTSHGGALFAARQWSMSDLTAFPALNTNTAATAYNIAEATSSAWGTYTANSFNRTISGQWSPGARTFRSLFLRRANSGAAYQLLLDSSQTQAADKTLVVGLNFAI